MNTHMDFLPIDFIVRKCNYIVMEWSKLYSNENNEHLPYEDFLALNEAALTIPVAEWLYLGLNQRLIPREEEITTDFQRCAIDTEADSTPSTETDPGRSVHQEPLAPSERGIPPRGLHHC